MLQGPVPPFAPLKLGPKCLKVTRPTLGPFTSTPEDFAWYAKEVFDVVKAGALKVRRLVTYHRSVLHVTLGRL